MDFVSTLFFNGVAISTLFLTEWILFVRFFNGVDFVSTLLFNGVDFVSTLF